MEEETVETPEARKKGSGMKFLIIILGASLILGAVGILSYVFLSGDAGEEGKALTEQQEEEAVKNNALVAFEPFIVNLLSPGRYLKVTMHFELKDAGSQRLVLQKIPVLRDVVITLLGSKSLEAVSGPEGKFQLKDEILFRANQAMGGDVFKNIYFTEFVMQ